MVISIRGILLLHDELSELYKTDPELFEVRCRELIEDVIKSCRPERQEHLRKLQWRIDQTLARYKDPIARMNKMIEMFWEGVGEFQSAFEGKSKPQKAAVVLTLPKGRQFP